jgi:hypothetical protein
VARACSIVIFGLTAVVPANALRLTVATATNAATCFPFMVWISFDVAVINVPRFAGVA